MTGISDFHPRPAVRLGLMVELLRQIRDDLRRGRR